MDYIRICDWETFQHYTKRNPPWIKLHTSLLDNEKFECLQNDSKVLLICLWLFNSRKGNGEIPADSAYLRRKLPVGRKIDLQPLVDAGFIECYQDDSKAIATDDSKVRALDRDRDRDKRKTEKSKDRYMDFIFLTEEEYEKLVKQFGAEGLSEKIAALNDYVGSTGRKYKSHYHTILNWERKERKDGSKTGKSTPESVREDNIR